MPESIKIADIVAAPARYQHVIAHYAERLRAGERLTPLLVKRDSQGRVTLVDGHHRYFAALSVGRTHVECFVWSVNAVTSA
jgi:ParB-like chromosome segregation protein Spo0J